MTARPRGEELALAPLPPRARGGGRLLDPAELGTTSLCASEVLRQRWHAVAASPEIDTGPCGVRVLGESFAIWRGPDGTPVAAPDRCPHREAPLSCGEVDNGELICAYHGWRYGSKGRCVLVPSSGAGGPIPSRAHLETVGVAERYGLIWLRPDPAPLDGQGDLDLPVVDEDGDPEFRRLNVEVQTWRTSVGRMVDNFLDYSHFPWVHRASFGGATDPEIGRIDMEQMGDFTGYRYSVEAANPQEAAAASGSSAATVGRTMTTGFALPFLVRSSIAYDSGLRHVLLLCSTPIDELSSYFTFVVWRNDGGAVPAEEILRFDRQIGEEDRRMLERVPGPLPLGATDLLSVQSDRPSVEWRRQLRALMAQQALSPDGSLRADSERSSSSR